MPISIIFRVLGENGAREDKRPLLTLHLIDWNSSFLSTVCVKYIIIRTLMPVMWAGSGHQGLAYPLRAVKTSIDHWCHSGPVARLRARSCGISVEVQQSKSKVCFTHFKKQENTLCNIFCGKRWCGVRASHSSSSSLQCVSRKHLCTKIIRLNCKVKDWDTCDLSTNNLWVSKTGCVYTATVQESRKRLRETLNWARTACFSLSQLCSSRHSVLHFTVL